jgi:hypothetical protein
MNWVYDETTGKMRLEAVKDHGSVEVPQDLCPAIKAIVDYFNQNPAAIVNIQIDRLNEIIRFEDASLPQPASQ